MCAGASEKIHMHVCTQGWALVVQKLDSVPRTSDPKQGKPRPAKLQRPRGQGGPSIRMAVTPEHRPARPGPSPSAQAQAACQAGGLRPCLSPPGSWASWDLALLTFLQPLAGCPGSQRSPPLPQWPQWAEEACGRGRCGLTGITAVAPSGPIEGETLAHYF